MSKIVRHNDVDYTLAVSAGGQIILDTGLKTGTVIVTGDLLVKGHTSTIQSETLVVTDNIIVVNNGETQAGISLSVAGLQIDRGTLNNAYFLFGENVSWKTDQGVEVITNDAAFVVKDEADHLLGLYAKYIGINGVKLTSNSTALTVESTYTPSAPNDIPTVKWVDDAIAEYFSTQSADRIVSKNSSLIISDFEVNPSDNSNLTLTLTENNISHRAARWYIDKHEVQNIRITDNAISVIDSSKDLVLNSTGSSSVTINDVLKLNLTTSTPIYSNSGIKLYATNKTIAGTGIFFINAKSTRDELVSRRKALAYSMIF